MAVPLEQFVKQLEDSGLVAGETLMDFIPPKASPKDAEELVGELIRHKKLTKFQAEEVANGNGKSLVLGNYVLLEKIGAGGMGEVYKAEHRRMDRLVAVKVLPASTMKDPATVARFEREVKAAAKISHPNIVAAHDADCANGIHFLVMELVEGSDLSALVKKNGPFPVEKAINYVLQAAKGLEAAHAEGIVHRDIKPSNLLLDKKGTVKILDMGLARIETAGADVATQAELTGSGAVMGTVDYMAPEQAISTRSADARADIYSLGCTMYYLLNGKAAYSGGSVIEKILAHREKPVPSISSLRPEAREQLQAVFNRMVAKKVEDRYQTMADVIAALEKCAALGKPLVTPSAMESLDDEQSVITPQTVVPKPASAHSSRNNKPLLVGAGLLAIMALLAGLVISLKTKEGTLVVTVNEPDAEVKVLTEAGVVEVSQKGGSRGPLSISVDPGKHRLKVTKDGFAVFGQDFEVEAGGKKPITAKLVPLEQTRVAAATKAAPVPTVAKKKKPLFFETPEFDQWFKKVSAMPAEQQVEAVSKKLMELNPGFDGKVAGCGNEATPDINSGVVVSCGFVTDKVSDISPVRAFTRLRALRCSGSGRRQGQLEDLSPLKGMSLQEGLACDYTMVSDLSPLIGMKLNSLNCVYTQISDLSPLKGMPLTWLGCVGTQISDISILKGMALSTLSIEETQVSDLSALEGMPLTALFSRTGKVTNLSPLKGMPLKNLSCDFNPERDTDLLRSLTSLENINHKPAAEFWKEVEEKQAAFDQWVKNVAAMPAEKQVEEVSKKLVELNPGFDGKVTGHFGKGTPLIENGVVTQFGFDNDHGTRNVTDISPLRAFGGLKWLWCGLATGQLADLTPLKGTQLVVLVCPYQKVSDLSPLAGLKLEVLDLAATPVSDLSPLKDMPLGLLGLADTPVSNISILHGMTSLKRLYIRNTQVSDLRPLQGMKLDTFSCDGAKVSDLSPLKDMPLRYIWIEFKPDRDTALLRSFKELETINDKPVAEFWKEVEEKGKKE